MPPTQHYVSVLSQAECNIEEFEDTHSLVPKLGPTLKRSVQSCPELIKSDLSALYPAKDFSGSRLTSISFHYSVKNPKDSEHFEHIYELFVQSALDVCASLNQLGYWADFMHPKTGIPANHAVLVTVPFIFSSLLYLKYFIESPSMLEKSVFKCAPIVWLATFIGIIRSYAVSKSYTTFISIGLLFCSIGDIFLVYDIEEFFISGLVAFAIGHGFYIIAYGFKPLRLPLFLPLIVAFLIMNYHFASVLRGSLVYAIPAYSFILSTMIWRAVSLAVENSSYSLALGCILFGVSDALLGINVFLKPLERLRYSVMSTYYLGQLCIAISTLSIKLKQKVV
ncbi:hypothetical protein ACTXT7_009909 [Hymenolepis weldensis]